MKHRKFFFSLSFFSILFLFVLVNPVFAYEPTPTHRDLTKKIIETYNKYYQPQITPEQAQWIIDGSIKEDAPPRWISHLYDPVYQVGWTGEKEGDIPADTVLRLSKIILSPKDAVSSLDWLHNQDLQTKYSFYEGNQTYERALSAFAYANLPDEMVIERPSFATFENSYKALGHTLHLLEDLGVPAHTRNDTHADVVGSGDQGEPYEKWVADNTSFNHLDNLDLQKENYSCAKIDDCFIQLAKYSNENFYSKDTIDDPKYKIIIPEFIKDDGGKKIYFRKDQLGNLYPFKISDINKNFTIKDPFVHQAYWNLLSKQIILAGVQVIKSFNQDARDESENAQYPQHIVMFKRISFPMFSPYGTLAKLWNYTKLSFAQAIDSIGGFFSNLGDNDNQGFQFAGQVSLGEEESEKGREESKEITKINKNEQQIDNEIELTQQDKEKLQENQIIEEENFEIEFQNEEKDEELEEQEDQQEIPELITELTHELIQELTYEECNFGMGDGQMPSHKGVIINEVAWMGTRNSSSDEWIELKNISNNEINISGWQLIDKSEQIKVVFDNGIKIPTNNFYILERTDDNSVPGIIADFVYTGVLSNDGKSKPEGLRLFDGQCNLVDEVLADSDWPAGDNTQKRSMERSADFSWHTYNGTANNNIFGTPKAENSQPTAATTSGSSGGGGTPTNNQQPATTDQQQAMVKILISEIQISGATTNDEFIELYNPNFEAVDLTGWAIKRKSSSGKEYSLLSSSRLDGKNIPAKGYFLAVNEEGYDDEITSDASWAKSNTIAKNNTVILYDNNQNIIDKVGFGKAQDFEINPALNPENNHSISRQSEIDTDNNANDFEIQTCPSPKAQPWTCQSAQSNQPPSAFFVFLPQNPKVNEEIIFNVASSTDPDGSIVLYDWDFGDSTTSTLSTATTTHIYPQAGDYPVSLIVFDEQNATSTASSTIIVSPAAAPAQTGVDHPVISEILFDAEGSDTGKEFIEIYNPTGEVWDLSDWSLKYIKESSISTESLASFGSTQEDILSISVRGFFLVGLNNYDASNYDNKTADIKRTKSLPNGGEQITIILYDNQNNEIDRITYSETSIAAAGQSLERKAWQNNQCVSSQLDGEFLGNGCEGEFEIRSTPNPQNSQSLPEPRSAPTAVQDFNLSYSSSTVGINFSWQPSQDSTGATSTLIYKLTMSDVVNIETTATTAGIDIDEVGRDYNFSIQALDKDGLGSDEIASSTISVPSFLKEVYFYQAPAYRAEHFRRHPTTRNSDLGLSDTPYLLEFTYDQYPFLPDKVLGGQVGDFPPGNNWKAMVFYLNQEPLKDEFMYGVKASSSQATSFKYKNCIGYYSPSSVLILADSGERCREWGKIYTKAHQIFHLEDKRIFLEMATSPNNLSSEDYLTIAYYGFRQIQGFDNFKLIAINKTKYHFQDSPPAHQQPTAPSDLQFSFNENSSDLTISFTESTDPDTIDSLIAYEFNYATSSEAGFNDNNWQLIGADPAIFEVVFNNTYIIGVRAIDEFGNKSSITSDTWPFPDDFIVIQEQRIIDEGKEFNSNAKSVAQVFIPARSGYAKSIKIFIQAFYGKSHGTIQAFLYDTDDPNNTGIDNLLASSTKKGVSSGDPSNSRVRTFVFQEQPFLEEGHTYAWIISFGGGVSSNLKGTCGSDTVGGFGWARYGDKWESGNCLTSAKNYYFSLMGSVAGD